MNEIYCPLTFAKVVDKKAELNRFVRVKKYITFADGREGDTILKYITKGKINQIKSFKKNIFFKNPNPL